jgi:acetyl-CoA acyltransferase 2
MNKEIVIVNGARTPFGTFCGTLKNYTATDLGVFASIAALERSGVAPEMINHVVFGNAQQTSVDALYLARHIGLRSGVPLEVPALTVNRICGSGFQSIVTAAQLIQLGEADFVLAGGAENMSQAPHVIWGARWGLPLGQAGLVDSLWQALTDTYTRDKLNMAQTAENLAIKYKIGRYEVDEFAVLSQMRAKEGWESGRLAEEVVPVKIFTKKGTDVFSKDEHYRPDANIDGLAKLRPVFRPDGVVTAGNASGIADGAAAVVVTTMEQAKKHKLKPMARLVAYGIAGCEPEIMGIGPAPASRQALKRAGFKLEQMDLVEINEAFSPQYLAVEKELGLDRAKTNVNGGAIALGHPLGASGTRLSLTIMYELKRRKARYGLASACIGGGQGIAVIVENMNS